MVKDDLIVLILILVEYFVPPIFWKLSTMILVLILILVEYFVPQSSDTLIKLSICLNPCFSGILRT